MQEGNWGGVGTDQFLGNKPILVEIMGHLSPHCSVHKGEETQRTSIPIEKPWSGTLFIAHGSRTELVV